MAKRRANGEGNIRKRSDGRWEGRYTAGRDPGTGKVIYKNVLAKTQKECKEKLKRAIEEHQNRIYISGKLAKRVRKTEKLKTLSAVGLTAVAGLAAAGAVGAAAAPATGGASTVLYFAAVKTAAVTTGMSVPTLLLIAMVGLTAISTLLDEYTKVHLPGGILFERKRHRSAAPVSRPAPVPKVEAVPKEGGPKT